MDNQNQNPPLSQPQDPETQISPTNPPTPVVQSPKMVIQPSEQLMKEMAANPASYSQQASPNISTAPDTQSTNSNSEQTQTPKATYASNNQSSIYPEVSNDNLLSPNNHADKPLAKSVSNNLTKLITVGVIVLGLFIAVPALLSMIGWARIISYGNISVLGKADLEIYIIDAVYLVVGVGIILRKELARITYVIIGIILLLIGLYGTINYFRETHSLSGLAAFYAAQAASDQTGINGNQTSINSYESNTSIPATQKQQIISGLESDLKNDKQQLEQNKQLEKQNSGINSLVKLIPTYLLAIIPLLFLTRSRVREVFS